MSKIDASHLELSIENYSMNENVHSVSATGSLAAAKKLPMEAAVWEAIPLGRGDAQRLAQLLGNALKFTDEGKVRVADIFSVSVVDTGISAAQQARVFYEFHQMDSPNTNKKGATGLGLAIAKQNVALHGGPIGVESQFGKGSTFQCELPVKSQQRMGVS